MSRQLVYRSEDRRVARGLLRGDKRVLREFYKEYYSRLVGVLVRKVRTREDAEEIAQDVFISFLEALPVFGFRSSLWTFMRSIARHEVADYYRKLYAKRAIKYVPFVDQVYEEPLLSDKETQEWFYAALGKIKPKERQLVEWKYEQKLSVKEIAAKLGLSIKAAESRLFRARQAFQVAYLSISSETELKI